MDDALVICDQNFDIAQSLDKLGSVQNDIALTYEEESNNKSPFFRRTFESMGGWNYDAVSI